MNQQERVIQYVLTNGPCSVDDVYRSSGAKVNPATMRRYLVKGAPPGKVAYERKQGMEHTLVLSDTPPEGFSRITLRTRRSTQG